VFAPNCILGLWNTVGRSAPIFNMMNVYKARLRYCCVDEKYRGYLP
jgi:hypothetical protein